MTRIVILFSLLLTLAAPAPALAQANGCYADYKAQRTSGGQLQLHYGVIKLGNRACTNPDRAQAVVSRRISVDGWTLLRLVSRFDESGLNARRGNAGQYFLRY